ncbi:MAG: hypothetical protein IKZ52_09760 [Bacteroidales bacterium]|nr:hypothetical protein [Bacteroidales bacterium]
MKRFLAGLFASIMLCAALSTQAQMDSIPFLLRGHLILHATINDTVDCDIIYDTGAADLFGVDSVWLSHSQWKPQHLGYANAGGGAGRTLIRIVMDQTKVHVGSVEEQYIIVPIFQLRDVVSCHIDGIMGIKNIDKYPFEINFEHNYLKQYKTGVPNTNGYVKLPIKYENNRIYIQAETCIGGKTIKGWYLMDTGSGGTVDFTAQTTEQYQLDAIPGKRYFTDVLQMGLGDKKQEAVVDMLSDWIVIGNDTIKRNPISYIPEGTGAFGTASYMGVIGNIIWSNYNIIIDARNQTLYLRRFKPQNALSPTYGYSFRNRTDIGRGWIVSSLERESDAVNAGMALGDTIITVNGRNVKDYTWEEEYHIDEQPSQVLEIIDADGQEKRITLESKMRW